MGDFCQRQLGSTSEAQLPDLCPHGFQRRGADGWGKSAEQRGVPRVASPPRPKTVSEKVKLDVRILTFALSGLAVDDPGLRRVHLRVPACNFDPESGVIGAQIWPLPREAKMSACA